MNWDVIGINASRDICRKAEEVAHSIDRRYDPPTPPFFHPSGLYSHEVFAAIMIAKAVAEERERCATLVETWAQDNETVQPSFTRMAEAIRAGKS